MGGPVPPPPPPPVMLMYIIVGFKIFSPLKVNVSVNYSVNTNLNYKLSRGGKNRPAHAVLSPF